MYLFQASLNQISLMKQKKTNALVKAPLIERTFKSEYLIAQHNFIFYEIQSNLPINNYHLNSNLCINYLLQHSQNNLLTADEIQNYYQSIHPSINFLKVKLIHTTTKNQRNIQLQNKQISKEDEITRKNILLNEQTIMYSQI
ncbi:hypothetical protein ABPG74_006113 [Tetrahymena malaccensis]